jgi:hypothetical protein
VRVLQPCRESDFALKAIRAERCSELRPEDFQGYESVVFEVLCEVDRGHAAAPEFALEYVAIT